MKDILSLKQFTAEDIAEIFAIADEIPSGKYNSLMKGRTAVLFFPESSIRTRITFEKGVALLSGQSILFPPETLDKKEELRDVCGYLDNWADIVIVRHSSHAKIDTLAECLEAPVINAMTKTDHPCEMLTDMYALSKIREDFTKDKFLFVGKDGNIGRTWKEASEIMGFSLEQCCAPGCEVDGLVTYNDIESAIVGKDIVCTDALSEDVLEGFRKCQVTKKAMDMANPGAVLNPCPPFFRGEEVSADVIDSEYFVGYDFKKYLLEVQQALIVYCLTR